MPEPRASDDDLGDESTTTERGPSISQTGSEGLAGVVQMALGTPSRSAPRIDATVGRGGTLHLGADYLSYARQKFSAAALKKELEARLAPVYARGPGPVPGQPFGKFQVLSFLGKGGMAEVFKAVDPERDPKRGQEVALKVMKDDLAGDPTYVRRFLREAANAALVESENVVQIHEVGAVRGRVYFTMELVQGHTLKERLTNGPMSEGEGLSFLRQLVSGLVAAHEKGIGHRDLKPSNIMLAEVVHKYGFALQGDATVVVKIMDFGLARMYADDDEPEVDAEGRILGTAKYVAPELIAGTGATLQSDVFSLGVMAFQVFSGRAPWKAKSKLDYLEMNLRHEAPGLREFAPNVSHELAALVAAMLEKDPAARPTTVSLLRDLDRLIQRRSSSPIVVGDDPTSIFYSKRTKRSSKAKAKKGGAPPWIAVGALLGVVVLVVLVAALVFGGAEASHPPPPPPAPPSPSIPDFTKTPVEPPRPAPDLPADAGEMVLAKRPSSLGALAMNVKDEGVRMQIRKDLEEGDRAWLVSDFEGARDHWRAALTSLGGARALQLRVDRAERELALTVAKTAESDGKLDDALAALDEAEKKGAPAAIVEAARRRVRERRADEQTVRDALAESQAHAANGEWESALAKLRAASESFARLDRKNDLAAKLAEIETRKGEALAQGRAEKLLDEARASLERGELGAATAALDAARTLAPDAPGLAPLARRLARTRGAPAGTVYVELDAATGKGLYARKAATSNREWKAWLDSLPPGKRKPAPWISGSFPPDEADAPVKNVKQEDAKAFAESRGERLPSGPEREAIGRATSAPASEGTTDARGLFSSGFRTVQDPPEDRP